jgi:6-phosphogluconolactonase
MIQGAFLMIARQMLLMGLCLGFTVLRAHADSAVPECSSGSCPGELVYIGTMGVNNSAAPAEANAQGIYAARLDEKTGHLSLIGLGLPLQRATWLVTHPRLPVIYSVANSAGGMAADSNIYSLAVDRSSGKLRVLNQVDAGGRDATHLALDAASGTLFSANHGSGDVSALPIQADGSLGMVASNQKDYGSGPSPRQKTPAAHSVIVDPSHRYVLVADFGADRIFVYHFDAATRALRPAQPAFEALPPGSGPRHMAFDRSGHFLYLDTELSAQIHSYRWDSKQGQLQSVQTLSPYPVGYSGEKSAAEMALARDGRFLYLSIRGDQDSIVVYSVNRRSGALQELQHISSQGKTPWSFGIDPTGHWMLVTNEASDSVVVFKIDPATGKLSPANESLSIPKPCTVTFYAR